MTFKSNVRPLCRAGKPIGLWTATIHFGSSKNSGADHWWRESVERPPTREDAQRLVNEKIVSIRWSRGRKILASEMTHSDQPVEARYVSRAALWDGETYADKFFCKGTCASAFAYMAASSTTPGIYSQAWADAMRKAGRLPGALASG